MAITQIVCRIHSLIGILALCSTASCSSLLFDKSAQESVQNTGSASSETASTGDPQDPSQSSAIPKPAEVEPAIAPAPAPYVAPREPKRDRCGGYGCGDTTVARTRRRDAAKASAESPNPRAEAPKKAAKAPRASIKPKPAGPPPPPESSLIEELLGSNWRFPWEPKNDFETVRVFYGTNRAKTEDPRPYMFYGPNRGTMTYGTCDVTIPLHGRDIGEIPRPFLSRSLENRNHHFILGPPHTLRRDEFIQAIRSKLEKEGMDATLVFVHGFRVTFEDAAFRSAQIALDLHFTGPTVFFSWPSMGRIAGYMADHDSAILSLEDVQQFLVDIASLTGTKRIYLIAHSMGNELLPRAFLNVVREHPELQERFRELILAAPDVDADIFKQKIAPFLAASKIGVTLYASDKDKALEASREAHAGLPRAGDMKYGKVVFPGIETIDASQVETDFILEHSYFGDAESVLSDIFYIVQKDLRAKDRFNLTEISGPNGKYWELRPKRWFYVYVAIAILACLVAYIAFSVRNRKIKLKNANLDPPQITAVAVPPKIPGAPADLTSVVGAGSKPES